MSALKEDNVEQTERAEAVEIIDCGRASERTKGINFPFFMESATPPMIYWG